MEQENEFEKRLNEPVINKKPVYLSTFHKFKDEAYARIDAIESRQAGLLVIAIISAVLSIISVIIVHFK